MADRHVRIDVDGTEVPAYLALPEGSGPNPGMLVIEEIFGVNDQIRGVCRRLASEGYAAISMEHFHRESEPEISYTDRETAMGNKDRLKDAEVVAEMRAGVDFLKGMVEVDEKHVGVIGYCLGGMLSYLAAAKMPDLAACVVYYGTAIVNDDLNENTPVAPISLTKDIRCPVLGHFGENDHVVPLEHVEQIKRALSDEGKTHEIFVYEGALHAFFREDDPGRHHSDAARLSWERTLAFLEKNLKD